jgi:nucleoside-diphosphate-sugar epimerase
MASDRPGRRALVIGGSGYIGQEVSRRFLEGGYEVTSLDLLIHGQTNSEILTAHPGFTFVKGDFRDPAVHLPLVREADVIILLAAIVGEAACELDAFQTESTNYTAPLAIRKAAVDCGRTDRLIFASTDSCYGKRPGERLTESAPLAPCSRYAELKARIEEEFLSPPYEGNPAITVLRLATVYGLAYRMRFDLAVNLFVREATVNKSFTVFSGRQWRPLLHVRDAADAFFLAATSPRDLVEGEVFNTGSDDQNIKFIDLAGLIVTLCPDARLTVAEGVPDLRDYQVKFGKIRHVLGFRPRMSLAAGISEIRDALSSEVFPDPYSKVFTNSTSPPVPLILQKPEPAGAAGE